MSEVVTTAVDSPVGTLRLVAGTAGLIAVLWPGDREDRVRLPDAVPADPDHVLLRPAVDQLGEYFAGTRQEFVLALDPRGTEFQRLAWAALARIPFGETRTYAQQASEMGRPAAVRAVGGANGRNPLSIVVPCHRVVGADGSLTGFAGGVPAKAWLLDHEARVRWPDGAAGN